MVGGIFSNIAAGLICDKYEPVYFKTKPYFAAITSLIAVPLFAVAYLCSGSFALSMSFQLLEYLICEGYMPPTVAMLLTCVGVENKGIAIGALTFTYTMAGTVATFVNGAMIKAFNGENNPANVGVVIAINTCVSCFFAAVFYWKAGSHYEQRLQAKVHKTDAAIEKVSAYHISLRAPSIASMMSMRSFKGLTK